MVRGRRVAMVASSQPCVSRARDRGAWQPSRNAAGGRVQKCSPDWRAIVDAGDARALGDGVHAPRVRMIAASFLTMHLLQPWQDGEAWFWDTLVDADLASNAQNWQWVAGSGADAAPYFRIFNPIRQGKTFDPGGNYVRRWVPELSRLPASAIHAPWLADPDVLTAAGVAIGRTYPAPLVDHAEARARAIAAFTVLKDSA